MAGYMVEKPNKPVYVSHKQRFLYFTLCRKLNVFLLKYGPIFFSGAEYMY